MYFNVLWSIANNNIFIICYAQIESFFSIKFNAEPQPQNEIIVYINLIERSCYLPSREQTFVIL